MPGVSYSIPPALSDSGSHSSEPNVRIVIRELTKKGRQFAIGLMSVAAGLIASGCGTSGGDYGGEHPDYAKALAGAPAPLAALYKQGNELLAGGDEAFDERVASLKGYPVVVNVWASWCGPCRFEFPTLQQLSARYGKRVAFLGVDSQDSDDAAKTFLEEAPVPYPSYTDGDRGIARSIGTHYLPNTAFYDRHGQLCHLKLGPYTEHADLASDIKRFALREECESA